MTDQTGRVVRYGLRYPGKGSERMNQDEPSPDYIVAMPIEITAQMVGKVVCIMGGLEMKAEDSPLERDLKNPKTRAFGQNKWIQRLLDLGGFGGFIRKESDIDQLITNFFKRLNQ